MARSHFALAILLVAYTALYLGFATTAGEPAAPDGPSDSWAYFPTTVGVPAT